MNTCDTSPRAAPVACTCDSMKPGTTVRPPASMTRVCGPAILRMAAVSADGGEGVSANRDRFSLRVLGVDGQHLGVDHDQVHRRLLTGRRRRGAEQANDGTAHPESVLHWHRSSSGS